MTRLLSFHNDKNTKKEYVKRLKLHAKADEIIKGQYWQNGKGCAVGCTIHSSNHNSYEIELGIPEWLARLEDTRFEGLSNKEAKKFAVDFLLAIPIGVDLNKIKYQFCSFILKENINQVLKLTLNKKLKQQVVDSIHNVLSLHEKAIKTEVWDNSARSALSAACSAASYSKYAKELLRLLKKAK